MTFPDRLRRVLFVGPSPTSTVKSYGGTLTAFRTLFKTDFLQAFSFDFVDTTTPTPPPALSGRLGGVFKRFLSFTTRLLTRRYDLLFLTVGGSVFGLFLVGVMTLLAKLVRLPVLLGVRANLAPILKASRYSKMICWMLSRVDVIWTQSDRIAAEMKTCPFLKKPHYFTVPNWSDFSTDVSVWQAPPTSKLYVLFLGWVIRKKGVFELVEAFSKLAQDFPEWTLVIAGDGDAFGPLSQWVTENSLSERIQLLGSVGSEKHALIQNAQFLVLPSYTEGFPNVVLEAMSYGRALIVSDVGSLPDVIQDGQQGLVVPAAQVAPLETALRTFMSGSVDYIRLGEFNFKDVRDTYDVTHLSKVLEKKIKEFF